MSDNKRIAKNTMFLYIRMLFAMIVSLYTSRIVLKTLGVEDFGLYNLVGGVVVLFSFLNNAMSSATQRFINVEMASKDKQRINRIFSVSINAHFIISVIVLILGETVGLWFLNYKLIIPIDRLYAANIVYQISLLTTIISIMRIPFNAFIIANERMSFFAVLGIAEVILKLIIVYLIVVFGGDKLIIYSILIILVTTLISSFYYRYCRVKFIEETKYKFVKDSTLLKELMSFSGWSLFGQVSNVSANQGVAMVLNMFFGVVINATMGIANQVNTAIYSFVSNLQIAFMPRITQSYAEGHYKQHINLVLQGSRFSFFLLLLLVTPIFLHTEYILTLWLGEFPEFTVVFTQLVLLNSLIDAVSGPFWMSANAIGNIRNYQIIISAILLLNLPLSYLFLYLGYKPTIIMIIKVSINIIALIFRYLYINKKLAINKKVVIQYFKSIFYVLVFATIMGYIIINYINASHSVFSLFLSIIFIEIILILIIALFGLKIEEIVYIKQITIQKFRNEKA